MRRRRAVPEAIGLSVLDLVCGLFGLLVVLYATTERVDGNPGVLSEDLKFVRIQLADRFEAVMGLEIEIGGETLRSWPECISLGPVTWGKCENGMIEALLQSDADIDSLRFLALTPPTEGGTLTFDPVEVWVTTPDDARMCTLTFSTVYRGDFSSSVQCPPT